MIALIQPTAVSMDQITTAFIALTVTIITGFGIVATALFLYIKSSFERRSRESELQLKDLAQKIDQRKAEADVEVERDRVLPQLIQSINAFVSSSIQQSQMMSTFLQAGVEQNGKVASELHTQNVNTSEISRGLNTLKTEFTEVKQQIESMIVSIQNHTTTNAASSRKTIEKIEQFEAKLDTVVAIAKKDTGPIPSVSERANGEEKSS